MLLLHARTASVAVVLKERMAQLYGDTAWCYCMLLRSVRYCAYGPISIQGAAYSRCGTELSYGPTPTGGTALSYLRNWKEGQAWREREGSEGGWWRDQHDTPAVAAYRRETQQQHIVERPGVGWGGGRGVASYLSSIIYDDTVAAR
eukprot:3941252-Rhodomonas_salina.2